MSENVEVTPVEVPVVVPAAEVVPAPVVPVAPLAPVEKIYQYQAEDENGRPIGSPTYIKYTTEAELIEKMKTAHIHAVRAFHRLKAQKTTFRTEAPTQPVGMSDQELLAVAADLKNDDPAKAAAAVRKITDYDEVQRMKQEAIQEKEQARQEKVSNQFMRGHIQDFNPCEANAKVIGAYIQENNLEWTLDNLEVAFVAVESQLAPVPRIPVPEPVQEVIPAVPVPPVVNPTPAAPVVPVVTETSVAPQPSLASPNIKVVDSTRVRGVNTGGLQPGQLSGKQPSTKTEAVTIEQIAKWRNSGQLKAKMANPQTRSQIELTLAAHNAAKQARTS